MLIEKIEVYLSSIPLKEPFIISLGSFNAAENVIVIIYSNEGLIGTGECNPFPSIHGETAGTCLEVAKLLCPKLLGKDPLDISGAHRILDQLIYGNTSIKSAFDIALYDLAAKHAGLPLYKFLGGNKNRRLTTDYTVSLSSPEKMSADAKKIVENGFSVLKIKLGGEPEEDVKRVRLIREVIGQDIPIRIDANQGWNRNTALQVLQQLSQFKIQHCEEPIPKYDFLFLPELVKNSPIPIMADESCCDHHDAERLISLNACNLINVKLGKSSGLFKASKILKIAENSGIHLQAGGFLESRLAFSATAHLALSSEQVRYIDFDTPLMFRSDPVLDGMEYGPGGTIRMPDMPGIGASFDPTYLAGLPKTTFTT